jgi:hypothetical protein
MNQINGIFLELDRWLDNVDIKTKKAKNPIARNGILQIGEFNMEFFKKYRDSGFKNINYIEESKIKSPSDQARLINFINDTNGLYNVLVVNSDKGDEYNLLSCGIPKCLDVLIIRHYTKISKVKLNVLEELVNYLGFYLHFEAEHKGEEIIDLVFRRK